MPIPLIIGAAAALPGLIKAGQGIAQGIKANKLTPEEFQFIPPALKENLASQRNRARSARMPGQSLTESKIRQGTAAGLKAAGGGSLSDKIASAQGLIANEQNALAGVGAQASQFQVGEERAFQGLMNDKANIEMGNQRQFENMKLGLKDASAQNIFGGVSDMASSITGGAWEGVFGGGSKGSAAPNQALSTAAPNNFLAGFSQKHPLNTLQPGTFTKSIGSNTPQQDLIQGSNRFQAGLNPGTFNRYING